jgi:heat shock protein 4
MTLQEETADRKNAVEAYVYKLRNGLYGPLEAYARPEEKEQLLAALQVCGWVL